MLPEIWFKNLVKFLLNMTSSFSINGGFRIRSVTVSGNKQTRFCSFALRCEQFLLPILYWLNIDEGCRPSDEVIMSEIFFGQLSSVVGRERKCRWRVNEVRRTSTARSDRKSDCDVTELSSRIVDGSPNFLSVVRPQFHWQIRSYRTQGFNWISGL